jgi:type II secretory pathway predicted ATPase ExeA
VTWPPACCTATPPTTKPSPASPGCIAERAIGVITGEVGAGKTASVRTVLAGLDASRHTIIYLPNPMIGVRGLHEMIVATFGGTPDRSGSRLTAQASAVLAAERDERGRTPVLVIDEAHLLRYEQLETIRMLTNHNLDADSPLAALLVGQPTLRRTMKLAVLAALEQRVALRYTMPPMTSQETSSYISHHLKLAGRSDTLFSDDATALIHTTARGYPRAVNHLAIQALVATYAAGKAIVDEQAARAAVNEVTDT